jgi:predicted aspartyl protease
MHVPEQKKERSTSKVIVATAFIICVLLTLFAAAMMVVMRTLDPLQYIFPVWGVVVSAAVASYFAKAKAENVIKLQQALDAPPPVTDQPAKKKSKAKDPALLQNALQQAMQNFFEE